MIDLNAIDLLNATAVQLRKIGAEAGIKGASKGRKEDLLTALFAIAKTQREAAESAKATEAPKGMCIVCGVRKGMNAATRRTQGLSKDFSDQCLPCYNEGGWENTHSDAGHAALNLAALTEEQAAEVYGCWICYPELNEAKKAPRAGRSRAGMVIVAKGTEVHKSETFRKAAEAAGWNVTVQRETYELPEGTTGEGTRYYATAAKPGTDDAISLAWDGRAYDYPSSDAVINGKGRKVRNLKEALRLL
jgi:hypothetical protein